MLLKLQCKENIRSIQHAAGSSKISHILKLHATDLSLPCLRQGRSQHPAEAPLHHSCFLSSAGCYQDTALGTNATFGIDEEEWVQVALLQIHGGDGALQHFT